MRKNRFLILVALVLVCALFAVTVIGCNDKTAQPGNDTDAVVPGGDTGENEGNEETGEVDNPSAGGGWSQGGGSSSTEGKTFVMNNVDAYINFEVKADSADDIVVTDGNDNAINVDIKESNGAYTVWAPNGGYKKGNIYKIKLSGNATFVNYDEDVRVVKFSIANTANNIKLNAGLLTYPESAILDKQGMLDSEKTDAEGVTTGQMVLQINSANALEKDTVFLVQMNDGSQAAFKVVSSSVSGMQTGNCLVNYVKPDLSEIFEEFEYSGTSKMTEDSNVDFDYMDGKETLDNSELAMSIVEIFKSKPEFNVSVPVFENGKVVVDITITIPNVVTVEGYASSNLVITVHNEIEVEANANINKETVAEAFSLSAVVRNDITTTVSLGANGGYDATVNVPELMDKLRELANESEDDATAIPLLKWTVPIANGVASITYDADLVFRFSVAGDINAAAHAQLDYEVGVMYTKADGIDAYANELEGNGFDSVNVNLGGQAELKVGLRQSLGFDVLAGVLGIGIEAEIGNYNRLYGYGESSNLIDEADNYFVGGVYFEGGFYYDVDLNYGIKIGSLLNLADKADIVSGEIKGYEAGNRYLVLGVGATVEKYSLTALNTNVPSIYYKNMYDLVTKSRYTEVAAAEEFNFTSASADLVIENNVIKVGKTIAETDVVATYAANNDLSVLVKYDFSLSKPVLENDTIVLSKGAYSKADATVTFGVRYDGFVSGAASVASATEGVDLSVVSTDGNKATVSVPVKQLLVLSNGINEIDMVVDGNDLTLNVDVQGKVVWNQFANGNEYSIFTADQILDMIDSNASFDGVVLTITDNIDMKGAEIAPITTFNGVLQGNGKTISNYTVNAFAGENAGFVGTNNGTIDNIVFAGDVNVALEATTGKDYAVAGIAAVNKGTVSNCKYVGDVNVYSYGLAAFVDFDVAAVTAVNEGTLTANGAAEELTTVKVTVKFDLANVSVNIGDTTSTSNDIATVVKAISCEKGVKDVPVVTKHNVK